MTYCPICGAAPSRPCVGTREPHATRLRLHALEQPTTTQLAGGTLTRHADGRLAFAPRGLGPRKPVEPQPVAERLVPPATDPRSALPPIGSRILSLRSHRVYTVARYEVSSTGTYLVGYSDQARRCRLGIHTEGITWGRVA